MYRGATILSLDGKSRFAVPTKYREHLLIESNGAMVLTAHPHGCLLLYPKEAWIPIQSKIMQLSSFDKKSSGLQRLLVGYAEDNIVDGAGRLLISQALRDFAGIQKTIMFVGQGTHFEIWNQEMWNQEINKISTNEDDDLPEELGGFAL
ncbi:division/cell wall cluster transcriptional repressor MraZ [Methylophilaceae bacterium]|nr:division/cell wall cluster transcriptional repressor MraZ [Methylophilaceae bacterium]|tara:strand:+ start:284 stop:730 length:447 start_codon:yes stop_codon:yes gene_type:complete